MLMGHAIKKPFHSDGGDITVINPWLRSGPCEWTEPPLRAEFDVTPDGQRFLINAPLDESTLAARARIAVVLNWQQLLGR